MTPALPLTALFTHSTFNRFSRFYNSELTYLLRSHSFRSTRNFIFVHFPPEFFDIPSYFGYAYGATCTCPFCLPPSFELMVQLGIRMKTNSVIPLTAALLLNPGSLSLASRVPNYLDYLSNYITIKFILVNICSIA